MQINIILTCMLHFHQFLYGFKVFKCLLNAQSWLFGNIVCRILETIRNIFKTYIFKIRNYQKYIQNIHLLNQKLSEIYSKHTSFKFQENIEERNCFARFRIFQKLTERFLLRTKLSVQLTVFPSVNEIDVRQRSPLFNGVNGR